MSEARFEPSFVGLLVENSTTQLPWLNGVVSMPTFRVFNVCMLHSFIGPLLIEKKSRSVKNNKSTWRCANSKQVNNEEKQSEIMEGRISHAEERGPVWKVGQKQIVVKKLKKIVMLA